MVKMKTQGNIEQAQILFDRLDKLDSCDQIVLVKVTIGKTEFYGIRYRYTQEVQATERLVTEGPCKAGDKTWQYRYELCGKTPASYRRRRNTIYTWHHDLRWPIGFNYDMRGEWYIVCYFDKDDPTEHAPIGRCFTLGEHKPMNFGYYKDQRLDHYEKKSANRLAMVVEKIEHP